MSDQKETFTKTHHFDDPVKFLNAISRRSELLPSSSATVSNWIFRGQAQSNWELIPNVLRKPNNILDHLHSSNRENHWHQIDAEARVLNRFLEFADRSGLQIPEDSQQFRDLMDWFGSQDHLRLLRNDREQWPRREILSLLAIAQHYGIPTRLLDWTWQPFTAAYFAARDAARREENSQQADSNLAVWALSMEWLHFAKLATNAIGHQFRIGTVTAPYACCPNLHAQEGIFISRTLNQADLSDLNNSKPELSVDAEIVQTQQTLSESNHDEVQQLLSACRPPLEPLLQFTFPADEACQLLRELKRDGFTAARHFPGFQGATQAVLEWPLMCLSVVDD